MAGGSVPAAGVSIKQVVACPGCKAFRRRVTAMHTRRQAQVYSSSSLLSSFGLYREKEN